MGNFVTLVVVAIGMSLVSWSALAGAPPPVSVPEPVSMSLLAGGIVAIAAVKRMRRK